ncbi:MAG TPA: carboxymuconolactone decarboxylase family protein [Phycisphaerae bacterium]|nr:carboxymuconolactone decarboxylase family protein [Phycisphaerae bacterium]HRW55057.1 carboxymuconolactone decarboxylase family protein [Phycisphaerae bacterium]
MARIHPIDPSDADPKAQELLEGVQKKLGRKPNIFLTLAHSPAALQAYLGFSGAMATSALPGKLREQIALTVGQANLCDYCLAAHTAIGSSLGLSQEETIAARKGEVSDAKAQAAIKFSQNMVADRGNVGDADVQALRDAGYSDQQIVEIVAVVALNLFTNYFNHVMGTEVDFPKAPPVA